MRCTRFLIAGIALVGVLAAAPGWAAEQIFVVTGALAKDGHVSIEHVSIEQGAPSVATPLSAGDYSLAILSDFQHELYSTALPISLTLHGEPGGQPFQLNSLPLRLRLPFFFSAKTLVFKHSETTLLTLDLPRAVCAATAHDGVCLPYCLGRGLNPDCFQCGNGACDPGETVASCSRDCGIAPAVATTIKTPTPTTVPQTSNALAYVLAGGLALVVGLGALIVVKKSETPGG